MIYLNITNNKIRQAVSLMKAHTAMERILVLVVHWGVSAIDIVRFWCCTLLILVVPYTKPFLISELLTLNI